MEVIWAEYVEEEKEQPPQQTVILVSTRPGTVYGMQCQRVITREDWAKLPRTSSSSSSSSSTIKLCLRVTELEQWIASLQAADVMGDDFKGKGHSLSAPIEIGDDDDAPAMAADDIVMGDVLDHKMTATVAEVCRERKERNSFDVLSDRQSQSIT